MKDAVFNLKKALPNAGSSNTSGVLDLRTRRGSNLWRSAYIQVDVPNLSDHTDPSKSVTVTMQDSEDGVTFANTQPLIQISIPGVATTGSLAASIKVPVPPDFQRYIQFSQSVPTGAGNGSNAAVNYDLVI